MSNGIDADYIAHVKAQLALARKYAASPMPGQDVKYALSKIDPAHLNELIEARLAAFAESEHVKAEHIRDKLLKLDIELIDKEHPKSGELTSSWKLRNDCLG